MSCESARAGRRQTQSTPACPATTPANTAPVVATEPAEPEPDTTNVRAMKLGKEMRQRLVKGLNYGAELAEHDAIVNRRASHRTREGDTLERVRLFKLLSEALESGRAKPHDEGLKDTNDKTLEIAVDNNAMLQDLTRVLVRGEPLDDMDPRAVRAASRASKACWTTRVETARLEGKEDEVKYYEELAERTLLAKAAIVEAQNEAKEAGAKLPNRQLRKDAKAAVLGEVTGGTDGGANGDTNSSSSGLSDVFTLTVARRGADALAVEAKASDTIESVKVKIQEQGGPAPEQQRLTKGRVQLEEGKTLSDYDVRPRSKASCRLQLWKPKMRRHGWANRAEPGDANKPFRN